MESALVSTQLGFLHDAAHALTAVSPSLSRWYFSQFQEVCFSNDIQVPDRVAKRFCMKCSSLFIPSCNAQVRVNKIRNENDATKQASSTKSGIKRKGTCKSQSRAKRRDTNNIIDRTCVSTTHLDSTTGGEPTGSTTTPSSGLLNYISYKCGICGTETRWPGVTVQQSQSSSEHDIVPLQAKGQSKPDSTADLSRRSEVEDKPSKPPLKSVEVAKKKQKDKKKNDLKSLIAAKADQDRSSAGGYNLSDFLSTL
ncbi:hypothetical protein BC832DRAFT_411400 [Gaertneriomyces semiglobifer]|nr:hypothetical protein BC832DRAFT_411400 [Gaertneriomyces semiglobifer]